MREYIIRAKTGDEFDIPHPEWNDVYRPRSFSSEVIEGWGALRLSVAGFEVSFSPEPPGTCIYFESDNISADMADQIFNELLASAEQYTGVEGEVIPLQ